MNMLVEKQLKEYRRLKLKKLKMRKLSKRGIIEVFRNTNKNQMRRSQKRNILNMLISI